MIIRGDDVTAICFFCAVQLTYCVRHAGIRYGLTAAGVAVSVAVIGVFVTPLVLETVSESVTVEMLALTYSSLALVATAYAVCLLFSAFAAVSAFVKKTYPFPNNYLVTLGILFFLCCDINVGLRFLVPRENIFSVLVWVFYLPSQIMLCLSGKDFRLNIFNS